MSRPSFLPSSAVAVSVHVVESTAFGVRCYPGEERVTVEVAGSGGSVTLFLDHADLVRLREVLGTAERDLTDHQNESDGGRAISGPAT